MRSSLDIAVHQLGPPACRTVSHLLLGGRGVFHHVVQQRRHQGMRVQMPFGEQFGDCDRMRDIRITAFAELPGVADLLN